MLLCRHGTIFSIPCTLVRSVTGMGPGKSTFLQGFPGGGIVACVLGGGGHSPGTRLQAGASAKKLDPALAARAYTASTSGDAPGYLDEGNSGADGPGYLDDYGDEEHDCRYGLTKFGAER